MNKNHLPDRIESMWGGQIQVDENIVVLCPECLKPTYRVVTQSHLAIFFHAGGVRLTDDGETERYPGWVCNSPVDALPDPLPLEPINFGDREFYLGFDHAHGTGLGYDYFPKEGGNHESMS